MAEAEPICTSLYHQVWVDIVLTTVSQRTIKNSLVLTLRAFLRRKADKVIMTMVTLPDKDSNITHLSPQTLIYQPRKLSQEWTASIRTPPATRATLISSNAALRDCPTTIPTTAADPTTTDDEQPPASSNLTPSDDNTPDSFSLFIHEWNIFYHEFVHSTTY